MTGRVVIDSYGERIGEFAMHDFNPNESQFEMVISSKIFNKTEITLDYNEQARPIYWLNMESGALPDSPKCGYNRAKCPVKEPMPKYAWLLIFMGVFMCIMLIIGIIFYRRAQFEAELNAMNWLIKWEDVCIQSNQRKSIKEKKKVRLNRHFIIYS